MFRFEETFLNENSVKDGKVIIKMLYFSNDLAQKRWMQKRLASEGMYLRILENDPIITLG